jgi:hypothetical protein
MKSTLKQVGLALAILLMASACPSNKQLEEDLDTIVCRNNLKQLGLILMMWGAEHDNELPDALSELYPDYTGDDTLDICVCPSTGHEPGSPDNVEKWSDYVYLKGQRSVEEGTTPALLMYDKLGNHAGGRNELYTDGTVTWKPL